MNRTVLSIIIILTIIGSSCDPQSQETKCFPTRVKRTISTGTGANAITADYKYSGDFVDRIIWSNSQTHFFFYDDLDHLVTLQKINVQTLVKNEFRFEYENGKPVKIVEYRMHLDFTTQEDTDTLKIGYRELTYEDEKVITEDLYSLRDDQKGLFDLLTRNEYSYDAFGNISEMNVTDMVGNTLVESWSYTYDAATNPYSDLTFYFTGESFVNNLRTKTNNLNDEQYNYQIVYTANQLPSQVNVKVDGYLSEVIAYTYNCR